MATKTKTEFIGLRTTPEQRRKLLKLAEQAGKPGNMSAGLRWWLDQAQIDKPATGQSQQAEGAVNHA